MIAMRGIEVSFLIFFKIDVGKVQCFYYRTEWGFVSPLIKSNISSGVVGVMKNDSAFKFLRLSEKFFSVGRMFLEFFAYWCKVIIEMFCNIFWLTHTSAIYEKTYLYKVLLNAATIAGFN